MYSAFQSCSYARGTLRTSNTHLFLDYVDANRPKTFNAQDFRSFDAKPSQQEAQHSLAQRSNFLSAWSNIFTRIYAPGCLESAFQRVYLKTDIGKKNLRQLACMGIYAKTQDFVTRQHKKFAKFRGLKLRCSTITLG